MGDVSFKKLLVWKKADELAFQVYKSSASFPRFELYGMTSQIRRAAFSIPTNLAEGCGRQNRKETKHFANIALGSLFEIEYLLDFSCKLGYISRNTAMELQKLRQSTGGLLWKYYNSL